jgi:hypothetical protein
MPCSGKVMIDATIPPSDSPSWPTTCVCSPASVTVSRSQPRAYPVFCPEAVAVRSGAPGPWRVAAAAASIAMAEAHQVGRRGQECAGSRVAGIVNLAHQVRPVAGIRREPGEVERRPARDRLRRGVWHRVAHAQRLEDLLPHERERTARPRRPRRPRSPGSSRNLNSGTRSPARTAENAPRSAAARRPAGRSAENSSGPSSPPSVLTPARCPINWRSVTGHGLSREFGHVRLNLGVEVQPAFSSSRPTAADVSSLEAVPILNSVAGDTGTVSRDPPSRSLRPRRSRHRRRPPPTAPAGSARRDSRGRSAAPAPPRRSTVPAGRRAQRRGCPPGSDGAASRWRPCRRTAP